MPTHSSSRAPHAPSHSVTEQAGGPQWDDETVPLQSRRSLIASEVAHGEATRIYESAPHEAADAQHSPPIEPDFDVSDVTHVSPPEPPPDAALLPELHAEEIEPQSAQQNTPQSAQQDTPQSALQNTSSRRPLRAVLYLSLGILVGFLTHKGPAHKQSMDARKPSAAQSSVAAKTKSAPTNAVSKAELPASQTGLPPLPENYDAKDADTTAAAQAIAIGDYPTALRHYHALSHAHPNVEVFKVIVNVLRKRIQAAAKNE